MNYAYFVMPTLHVERIGITLFSWYEEKDALNRKHGISLRKGAEAFQDPDVFMQQDHNHPDRGRYVGFSPDGDLILTVYAKAVRLNDEDALHLVSARHADKSARKLYVAARTDPKGRRERSPVRVLTFSGFFARHHQGRVRPPRPARRPPSIAFRHHTEKTVWYLMQATKQPTPGQRISTMRRVLQWTQSELARRSGLQQSTLSHIESNEAPLGARRAARIAAAMRVEPAWLLWGSK
jgi:uncharacterized DUF497 family protein/DNA-binding XRE family transcriptional regulator